MMDDSRSDSLGQKKAWTRPQISRNQFTAEELARIDQADEPDAELRRVLKERQERPQSDRDSGGGW